MIAEPDVTLTDLGLALEGAVFAWLLARPGTAGQPLRRWFVLFFAASAVAALLGAIVHGLRAPLLWPLVLFAIGVTAFAACGAGTAMLLSTEAARRSMRLAVVGLACYGALVFAAPQAFTLAILAYLPATILLLIAFARASRMRGESAVGFGVLGLLLTLVAAALQQARVALPALSHNTLYHLVQAAALAMIFAGTRSLVAHAPADGAGRDG